MNDTINTDALYAHVLPLFWPVLWLNLYLLRRWYAAHGERIGAAAYSTSNFGIIRITKIYPRSDSTVTHMRAFEACSENWGLDQLGHIAAQFARANRVRLCAVTALLGAIIDREPIPQPPLDPG